MPIRKSDIFRSDIISPQELFSDGYSVYLSSVASAGTTSGTKTVVINTISDGEGLLLPSFDHPAQAGDIAYIFGSSGADGYYTIASIVSDTVFTVVESINNSTGGYVDFMFPVGAGLVGFNPTGLTITDATNVQGAIKDIDQNAVQPTSHETLRQLIHFISEGPGDLFAVNAYKEVTPFANPFPTNIVWYNDNTKTKKIIEKIITWSIPFPINITWNMYGTDGVTIIESLTDTIVYSGPFETSRTRHINL